MAGKRRGPAVGAYRRTRPTDWRLALSLLAIVLIAGCAAPPERQRPLPAELAPLAGIPGIPNARQWGDEPPEGLQAWLTLPESELRTDYSAIMDRPHSYLVVSGGGGEGAFGAGLLVGWTARGDRPEFQIVSGISTGALIAPFAFLGPRYDTVLQEAYTQYTTADLSERRNLIDILRGDAAADVSGLKRVLEHYLNDAVIEEIAEQGRRGRSLYIGTTNIDAARPVIWNITRMAASGAANAPALIRSVILASTAIPGAFPPVLIEVEADGESYDEMHVDGGVTAQLFLAYAGMDWRRIAERLRVEGRPDVYAIRNARLHQPWQSIPRRLPAVISRSVSTLIKSQGLGDLAKLYVVARENNLDYRIAYIPDSFASQPKEAFDRDYMRELFQLGYDLSLEDRVWKTAIEGSGN
jgi:predicted patatin/cPLA2 family phospholipase